MIVIGISGTNSSGKGTFKEYLEKKYNAISLSLSDLLREELRKNKIKITREKLLHLGNALRKKDPGILAKKIIKKIKKLREKNRMIIIDSIRNPYEIIELKKLKNFYLFFIDAPEKIRYLRSIKRKRENEEKMTFEEFKNLEKKEIKKKTKKYEPNLMKCKELSNFMIINDSTKMGFYRKIDRIINMIMRISKNE